MKIIKLNLGTFFLLLIVLILGGQQARAGIIGVHSVGSQCIKFGHAYEVIRKSQELVLSNAVMCGIESDYYPPRSGTYYVETAFFEYYDTVLLMDVKTATFTLDGNQTISQQSAGTYAPKGYLEVNAGLTVLACQWLVDDAGKKYTFTPSEQNYTGCHASSSPLPPTPTQPDISCTINNGNALTVNLGTIDRAQLPTVASSGTATAIPIPIACTGGNLTVNMKLSYTPITSGSSQAVKSSANGVGVAILYNDKMLSSTDNTSVNLLAGSNTLNLAFEAVRDASVEIKDIPTGAFSASAVLQMTQQ